jgi:hypothetical protein
MDDVGVDPLSRARSVSKKKQTREEASLSSVVNTLHGIITTRREANVVNNLFHGFVEKSDDCIKKSFCHSHILLCYDSLTLIL